jgi:hypothetical protein
MINLLPNPDWTKGFTTLPNRGNMRVPNYFYFACTEGLEPRLPDQDPASLWLAPEITFRSADGLQHGQTPTEQLPAGEVGEFLAPDVTVICHVFKGWGIQWWRLGINGNHQALDYKFSIELLNDVYWVRNNQRVPPDDPRAMEWRIRLGGDVAAPDFIASIGGFRKWHTVERAFTHPGGLLDVSIEVRARWGIDTVGAFLRRPSLVALNAPSDGGTTPPPVDERAAKVARVKRRLELLSKRAFVMGNEIDTLRSDIQSAEFELAELEND